MSDPLAGRRQELLERVVARGETLRRQRRVKFTVIAVGSTAVVVLIVAGVLAQRDLDPREVAPIASGERTATPSPTLEPTATAAPVVERPSPAPTPVPICTASDFEVHLVPDAKSHHQGGIFHFVVTARNISPHDCPPTTGVAYSIKGPKPSGEVVFGWGIHGDFFGQGPPPWSPGQVERSEFEWETKVKQYRDEPLEPGDYVVTFRFAQYCPPPDEPQTGPCAASASTTVTVEPASTPSPSASPAPLT